MLVSRKSAAKVVAGVMALMVGVGCMGIGAETVDAAVKKPAKVTGVKVSAKTQTSLTVKWKKQKNIKVNKKSYKVKYKVAYKKAADKSWKTKKVSKPTYKITGLKAGTKYQVKVSAYYTAKKKTYSCKYSKTVSAVTKAKPSTSSNSSTDTKKDTEKDAEVVKMTTISGTLDYDTYTMTWKAVSGAKSYQVYKKTGNGSFALDKNVAGCTYYDYSLEEDQTYSYKVRAVLSSGYSEYSNVLTVKVDNEDDSVVDEPVVDVPSDDTDTDNTEGGENSGTEEKVYCSTYSHGTWIPAESNANGVLVAIDESMVEYVDVVDGRVCQRDDCGYYTSYDYYNTEYGFSQHINNSENKLKGCGGSAYGSYIQLWKYAGTSNYITEYLCSDCDVEIHVDLDVSKIQ